MMVLMLRCILYPNSKLFVTTGGKEQAASITIAKIEEICKLIPALNNEKSVSDASNVIVADCKTIMTKLRIRTEMKKK